MAKDAGKKSDVEEVILALARASPNARVADLYDLMRKKKETQNLTSAEFVDGVRSLASEGKIGTNEAVPRSMTLIGFLTSWYRCIWLYSVIGLSIVTLLSIYVLPQSYPFVTARWATGAIFVLFLPGYVTVKILFPERELHDLERLAFSIGFSVAFAPLLGLLLNYSPWGIRLDPLIVGLTTYTVAIAFGAAWRRFQSLRSASLELT